MGRLSAKVCSGKHFHCWSR